MPKNAIASPYQSQSNNLTLSCTTSGQSSTMYTETLRAKVQQHTKVISTSTVPNSVSSTVKGSSLLAQTSTINATSSDTTLTCGTTVYDGNSNFQYVCTCCHNTFSRQMCLRFTESNYDFSNSIVKQALSNDIRYSHDMMGEFICKTVIGSCMLISP